MLRPYSHTPIPADVLEDTLLSLDILFPVYDLKTSEFLKQAGYASLSEGTYPGDTKHVKDFKVWRRRIFDLHTEYFTTPSVRPFFDRRNRSDFWNLRFALTAVLFTVAFGIISVVTSCMSTYYARLSYLLAVDAAKTSHCSATCSNALPTQFAQVQRFMTHGLRA
jgi:hypothetical protein